MAQMLLGGAEKRQIHHTKGLAHCRCRRRNSKSVTRIVMLPLSAAALAYARQPGFSALIFSDVKPPTGQSAAYKQAAADDLQQMGLTVLTENIFFGKPTGRRSERTTMAVVAQYTDGTDRWLRSILSGRPLDGSVMQTAANTGAITLKEGSAKAKVQLLPFDGDAYGVFAFVDSALLLNEAQSSERLSLAQRLMITPMVRTAAGQLVAATETALAQHEAGSANEALEAIQRCAATKKAIHQRNMRDALNRIIQAPDDYNCTLRWHLSRCKAFRALAPSMLRCRSSRATIATPTRHAAFAGMGLRS